MANIRVHTIHDKQDTQLCKLAEKHKTDKLLKYRHNYTTVYHTLFKDREVENLLEIGIGSVQTMQMTHQWKYGYKTGASLFMWRDYFPDANIYGIDISEETIENEERVKTFVCDQSNPLSLMKYLSMMYDKFDVVIDDGSHNNVHQMVSLIHILPHIKPYGIYCIEDLTPNMLDLNAWAQITGSDYVNFLIENYNINFYDQRLTNKPDIYDDIIVTLERKHA